MNVQTGHLQLIVQCTRRRLSVRDWPVATASRRTCDARVKLNTRQLHCQQTDSGNSNNLCNQQSGNGRNGISHSIKALMTQLILILVVRAHSRNGIGSCYRFVMPKFVRPFNRQLQTTTYVIALVVVYDECIANDVQ